MVGKVTATINLPLEDFDQDYENVESLDVLLARIKEEHEEVTSVVLVFAL